MNAKIKKNYRAADIYKIVEIYKNKPSNRQWKHIGNFWFEMTDPIDVSLFLTEAISKRKTSNKNLKKGRH